jgi:hypothetical protein
MRQIREAVPVKLKDKPAAWLAYDAKWSKRRYKIKEKPYEKRSDPLCGPRRAVFVPMRGIPRSEYNPMEHGTAIMSDLQRFANKPLTFVNRWGRRGIGTQIDDDAPYDEIEKTR